MRLFSDVSSRVADPHLARAAALAERASGATAPNPIVGCVIVADGRGVGEGFHERAGEPHAEVVALRAAGDSARGATAYVTLEPCSHHGKTPPCADALIAAGVARAVVGMPDPNPEAGGGADRLRAAGIEVEFAADPAPFEALNEGWLKRVRTGSPFVTAKLGLSLDAHGAFESGRRAAITGPPGAEVTRRLRAAADAVVVSAATVNADDPALTVREADGTLAPRQPLRVVLVRSTLPRSDARVFTDGVAETLVLEVGAEGLAAAFRALAERGVGEVLLEPGPRLFSAAWAEGAIDQLVTVTAGGFAGANAPAAYPGPSDRTGDSLAPRMVAVEAGIVSGVSATAWRPADPDHTRERD